MSRSARVEVAATGRSTCVHCGKLIARGEHRLLLDPARFGQRAEFFHLACALETHPKLAKGALAAAAVPVRQKAPTIAIATLPPNVRQGLDARPHDEATRRVYADWLEGQGNALGSFINASLDGREKDAMKLRKAHQAEWLGGVAPAAFQWKRGLVESASINARAPNELARRISEVLALPACACLETLELPGPIDAEGYAAVSRAAPRSLVDFTALLQPGIEQLTLPSLTTLTLLFEKKQTPLELTADRFPALRSLFLAKHWNREALDEATLIAIRDLPILKQLTEFSFVAKLIDPALAPSFMKGDDLFSAAIKRTWRG